MTSDRTFRDPEHLWCLTVIVRTQLQQPHAGHSAVDIIISLLKMRNFIGFCRRALDGPMLKYSCGEPRRARRQVGPAAGGWASPVGAWDTLWRHQCGNTMPLPRTNASSTAVNLRAPRPNNIARLSRNRDF